MDVPPSSLSTPLHYLSQPTYPHYSQSSSDISSSALFTPGSFPHSSHYSSHSLPAELIQSSDVPMPSMTPAPLDDEDQDLVLLSNISDLPSSSIQGFQNNQDGGGLSRPLTLQEQERLANLDRLKFFLATAPSAWSGCSTVPDMNAEHPTHPNAAHPALNRFLLPNQEYVTCVLWNGLYHITGTDIVRALVFRFEAFGRPVRNMKKFEEGVFSDLRNLKPGVDASLEEPKVCPRFVVQSSDLIVSSFSLPSLTFCSSINAYARRRSKRSFTGKVIPSSFFTPSDQSPS
jgi:transcription factor STE12